MTLWRLSVLRANLLLVMSHVVELSAFFLVAGGLAAGSLMLR